MVKDMLKKAGWVLVVGGIVIWVVKDPSGSGSTVSAGVHWVFELMGSIARFFESATS